MKNENRYRYEEFMKHKCIKSEDRKTIHQEEYYTAIQNCNNAGNSNEFIEFMLKIIDEAVDGMILTSTQEKIINLIMQII